MAESGLDSLQGTRDVLVEWKAFELRPGGQFPGTPEQEAQYRAMIMAKHEPMWNYARQNFNLEMREGPWGVNSRPALEGARFAGDHGREREYHHACFAAHWQESRRLDDPATLVAIARTVGLDGDAFQAAMASRKYSAAVDQDLQLARSYGITGIPAYIFGNRYLISGAQPVQVLQQVVDQCIAEGRTLDAE